MQVLNTSAKMAPILQVGEELAGRKEKERFKNGGVKPASKGTKETGAMAAEGRAQDNASKDGEGKMEGGSQKEEAGGDDSDYQEPIDSLRQSYF